MPPVHLIYYHFILLFFTGLAAGFVDSIAGGGGLVSLPVLLSVGLPPQVALGTNKLQGSFGTLSAAYNFIKKGTITLNETRRGILFTLIGAVIGALAIQQIDAGFLNHLVPFLLLFVFIYTLFSKNPDQTRSKPMMSKNRFFLLFGLGLGFYDGFFGPGTGSFWTGSLLIVLGMDMTKAAGMTRITNFTSNIVALSIFISSRNVLYSAGLCMATGQVIGARIGSSLAIKNGARFIRPIFLLVVLATIIRLIYLNYFR
ncbi:MAG: TSUP family transporter [Deltaproteobacteria bacterium]|nr:TSUP family transporter [Deltaproteobacteria bacterium]